MSVSRSSLGDEGCYLSRHHSRFQLRRTLAVAGVASEVAEIIRDTSIAGALLTRGRRAPLNVTVPRETTAPVADWLQEGKPTPMRAGAYAGVSLPAYKGVTLSIITSELTTHGGRDAEGLVTKTMTGSLGGFLDRQLLDNTVSALAGVRPASLTFGGTKVSQTGTTSAAITTDLAAIMAGITTSQSSLLWIGPPLTFARIALALPGTLESGRLLGIPYLANGNSPRQLTLIDVGEVLIALPDDSIDISVSTPRDRAV